MKLRYLFIAVSLLLVAGGSVFLFRGIIGLPAIPKSVAGIQIGPLTQSTPVPYYEARPVFVPSLAPIDRMIIDRISVNAPVSVKGVDAKGQRQLPNGPTDVAWYNFSADPGIAGNAVFSGHVDYIDYGAAVFWRLKELQAGDTIRVKMKDGVEYRYRVVITEVLEADFDTNQLRDILGPSTKEIVTLITCEGAFNSRTGDYNLRRVVRAERY